MCGSMVDIQSVTAEIRRGKKTEDTNHREKYKSSAVAEIGDRGHNRHGPNTGGVVPLSRGAGNPSNTMWPAPRSTSVPSGVFIHRAVWPQ